MLFGLIAALDWSLLGWVSVILKVAIGLAFGAYFVWWSLQVLERLTPEYDARTTVVARAS